MKYNVGDILFTCKDEKGRSIKGEIEVKVTATSTDGSRYAVQRVDNDMDTPPWIISATDLHQKSIFDKRKLIYVVELHIDEVNQGFAYLGSSLKHAERWIKNHGQKWCGMGLEDNAYYTIVGQEVSGDPMECESHGQYKIDGTPGRNPPPGLEKDE